MIFTTRKASGLPIVLEPEEEQAIHEMEKEGRYTELERYEKELRHVDNLLELKIECHTLEELFIFLSSTNNNYPCTIDFKKHTVVIQDTGDIVS